jgi:hypothetical protein
MRRDVLAILVLAFGLILAPMPLKAHHSFAAQFDANKPIALKGTITKVDWRNPHIYFYLDVKDANGKTVNWAIEGASATVLYRYGYTKNSVQPGNEVTMEGFLARDGSNLANLTVVVMDGKKILARIDSPGEK